MRNAKPLIALSAMAALFLAGCAGPEQRLGDGMNNLTEFARMGELNRSIEQTSIFDSPESGYTTGFIHGFDQSVYRTVMGAYQVVTFPAGNALTESSFDQKYVPRGTPYPDSYQPGLMDTSLFQTDTYFGFTGGDVAPFIPGSRFSVFANKN
jgi:putative exosortase-associated protein (TIGR04073 family)